MELKADFGAGERGLVELSFRDFIMQYDKRNQFETAIEVTSNKTAQVKKNSLYKMYIR